MFGRLPGARRVAELGMAVNEVARGKRVDKDEFVRRMNICRACDYNLKAIDMCRACGLFASKRWLRQAFALTTSGVSHLVSRV